ncbi:excinuclease ABC subunit UvrB [Sneathia sanguinegens]|uniref:excinuclease ABC subunit UvrB n=1 Tax=Sneathia sanguinegens TaxID=40543 RepID=UPI00258F9C8C|nr:excinuclease ABC subunit UvrB [Sneathia sanguinegens]MDU4652476.1 excinuclease ABC subunit UvrB [Sneathia sanguinegens]
MKFKLCSKFKPTGDQPKAIDFLYTNLKSGIYEQILLGVTGSGKTFTIANVIEKLNRPALVLAPNKTLAAQLYNEYKKFFPENAVEYFVSYYDYYQPEAYIPQTDTYIEKDSSINDEIDKLRHAATAALLTRRDVIIVASVSAIYGLGSKEAYRENCLPIDIEIGISRKKLISRLIELRYERNNVVLERGKFKVKGETIDVLPPYQETAYRFTFFDEDLESIYEINHINYNKIRKIKRLTIMPATHYLSILDKQSMFNEIQLELNTRVKYFEENKKLLEAQRIKQRTEYDLEMINEIGYCKGIENYSRYLSGKKSGEAPDTLLDYFPEDYVTFIDESHITVPQIAGMYNGDHARKKVLIENGFRLESAFDNRPLTREEFFKKTKQVVYVSATPSDYELSHAKDEIVEQLIRPTGITEPKIVIRPTKNQIDDLMEEIKKCTEKNQRVLVTTLTKKMAEELTSYYEEYNIKVKYMHSEIDAIKRVEIIKGLRNKEFDVLVGINLLREGLDIPEVSLVAILEADKEGFLRSRRSLIQTMGRAARNVEGKVILYADVLTDSIKEARLEVDRRREYQEKYNKINGIIPYNTSNNDMDSMMIKEKEEKIVEKFSSISEINLKIKQLEVVMKEYSKNLDFENAIKIRDKIKELKRILMELM